MIKTQKRNKPLFNRSTTVSQYQLNDIGNDIGNEMVSAEWFFLDFNPNLYSMLFTVNNSTA